MKEVTGDTMIVEGVNDGIRELHFNLTVRPFLRGKHPKVVALTDKDRHGQLRDKKLRSDIAFRVKWEGKQVGI